MHQKQHQQQNYRPVLELLIVISISEIYFFLSVQFCSVSVLLLLLAIVVAVCWLVRWLVGRLVGCCCQEAVSELVVAACGAVGIGNYTEAHTLRTVHNSHTHGLFWTQAVRQTVRQAGSCCLAAKREHNQQVLNSLDLSFFLYGSKRIGSGKLVRALQR